MNKQKLSIIDVVSRNGVSKRTGNPWSIHEAQCILEQESEKDGKSLVVGTLNLSEDLKDFRGDCIAEFSFFRSMEGKLEPRVVSLVPLGMAAAKAKPGAGVGA